MDYFAATLSFLRAAELSSFSKAATALAIKSSTVSRHIGELERDLGIALFNRSTRGLMLTEGGKTFLPRARQALLALEEARQATAALNLRPQGVLRVLLPGALGRRLLLPRLAEFLRDYPQIAIEAVISDTRLPLIEAAIDLAIHVGAPHDSGLMGRCLCSPREYLCGAPAYLRQHPQPADPQALQAHECLSGTATDAAWHLRNEAGDEHVLRPSGRLHCDDLDVLLGMAEAGHGIALLPDWLIGEALREQRLVPLLTSWQARSSRDGADIWAIYPPKKTVSSKLRAFIDYFGEILSNDWPAARKLDFPTAHN